LFNVRRVCREGSGMRPLPGSLSRELTEGSSCSTGDEGKAQRGETRMKEVNLSRKAELIRKGKGQNEGGSPQWNSGH